jgi:adenosylmethionine-8-amino-7-oxononanoate aminotransferase
MGSLSANGVTPIRTPFEPLVPGFSHVSPPYCYRCEFGLSYPACDLQCAKAVEQEIVAQGPDTVAAFIAEPVIGSAGCIPPPPEYFPLVRQICDRHGVLLILDEVICGFGRTGKLFASEHWNVVPDLMTVAKGLGSGYVPIGATIAKNEVYEQFLGDDSATFSHGITFGGHPVACAAALANVEIILREKLAERAAEMGRYLMDGLKQLEKHPIVGEIRGLGMLIGIELVADRQTKRQFPPSARVGQQISAVAWEMGLMVRNNWDIMQLSPPLVLTKEEADRVVDILDRSFAQVQAKLGLS